MISHPLDGIFDLHGPSHLLEDAGNSCVGQVSRILRQVCEEFANGLVGEGSAVIIPICDI